jgi:hypothetical protein
MNIMNKEHFSPTLFPFLLGAVFLISGAASAALYPFPFINQTPTPTPSLEVATPEELRVAQVDWELSAHADTFDSGMGANTTCARCKSPKNWDPSRDLAAQEALDCGSCKRIPGAPRPELESGIPVIQEEWRNIQCDICHIPVGDSYSTSVAFWDQTSRSYISDLNVNELCAKCHEGQHGFKVVEEQESSIVHQGWECTRCHGPHGEASACTDCHDPTIGVGSFEHARHPSVTCTACHDRGRLSIWMESDPDSDFFGTYITRRFAHTLTSWPSHNLSLEVSCVKCHHPVDSDSPVLVQEVNCQECHLDGAVLFWCEYFPRDPEPNPDPQSLDKP